MSVAPPATASVARPGRERPRSQRIGRPEPLGRNAARTLACSQGHVWLAGGNAGAAREHAQVFAQIDARGDALRARIWRHLDAALAACLRGGASEAVAELHAAQGLRVLYEEADRDEGEHVGAAARLAGNAHEHLGASAALHAALLSAGGEAE
jgi:hypothetical protein